MLNRKTLLSLAGLFWLVLVIGLYYTGHKPAEPDQFAALFLFAWRICAAALLAAVAGGLGGWIMPGTRFHPLARLALQGGLGFGLLGLGTLAVGSVAWPAWLPLAALALLGFLLRRSVLAWLRLWCAFGDLWRESGGFERFLAALIATIYAAALVVALAPPLHFDSLVYHLVLPAAYLQGGRVAYLPWNVMSGMPQTAELMYAWAMTLGNFPAAAALGWVFGLLAGAGLVGLIRQALDARAAWVGLAALLAGYTPAALLGSGYVDWLVFLQALGALAWLALWRQEGAWRSLLWAGAFTGLAVGAKYTSGVLALAGLVVLADAAWRRRRPWFSAAIGFGVSALALAQPWFVKNLVTTGNPVYPFFMAGGAMTDVRLQVYQHLAPWGGWMDVLLLPLRATYLGFDAGDGYMFAPGALLLGLGALAWLARADLAERAEDSPGAAAGGASPGLALYSTAGTLAAAGLLFWILGNQYSGNLIQTRYYFSIFPAFAVLAAAGEWGLRQVRIPLGGGPAQGSAPRSIRLGRLAAVVVLLALGLTTLEVTLGAIQDGALPAALGLKSEQAYLAEKLGWFQPAMQAAAALPQGKTVQLLYEARSLYCLPRCRPDEILDRWKRAWLDWKEFPAIRLGFLREGITHLLVHRQGMQFLVEAGDPHHPASDIQALERFLTTLPEPVSFGDVYELYSLEQ